MDTESWSAFLFLAFGLSAALVAVLLTPYFQRLPLIGRLFRTEYNTDQGLK